MPSNYEAIRKENERKYGTEVGRYGPSLLANQYADRTHFIFELLQNAEDALGRRSGWEGSREVAFELSLGKLRVSHWGEPFDEADVRGICGIAEGTKGDDLTSIGRFGIGFKSVYAFTDQPEIHSGDEHFAIENLVWPRGVPELDGPTDRTTFILPLKQEDQRAHAEIAAGLREIGVRTLLFMREIEEISWKVETGESGRYLRSPADVVGPNIRKVTVVSRNPDTPDVEETWLLFSRPVETDDGQFVGQIEIAFSVTDGGPAESLSLQPITESPLVVFFPTVVETHLGFLAQGPYRTTPSRDNIPKNDPWNRRLFQETGELVVDSLGWMRDQDLLGVPVLQGLPLDGEKFAEGSMFAPLFSRTKEALASEPLLPGFAGGYLAGEEAKLARGADLRSLLSDSQLTQLSETDGKAGWVSGDITQDRTPELRSYLLRELGIVEVTPEMFIRRLDTQFLESQSDEWIVRLYEYLNDQPALTRRARSLPLVRLKGGQHVVAKSDEHPNAFLPSSIETDFPTVRDAVCETPAAREFLTELGLTEADPVDDVIRNVLPTYAEPDVDVDEKRYAADVERLVSAFGTDSERQRRKLMEVLRDSHFVMAVDAGDGSIQAVRPDEVYLPTDALLRLFEGAPGVLFVDDSFSCLWGQDVRRMLRASGVAERLRAVSAPVNWEKRRELQMQADSVGTRSPEKIEDFDIDGLEPLLSLLPSLNPTDRQVRARLLWDALTEVAQHEQKVFTGRYRGRYYNQTKTCVFQPAFIERLEDTEWIPVPGEDGELDKPEYVLFDDLAWETHAFLQSRIKFKSPVMETLAREAGIEPGVIDLLKKAGVTRVDELQDRLGIGPQEGRGTESEERDTQREAASKDDGPVTTSGGLGGSDPNGNRRRKPKGGRRGARSTNGTDTGAVGTRPGTNTPRGEGKPRAFISYVAAHPDDEAPDPDGINQEERRELEATAIARIRAVEPELRTTPANNPGFDLFEEGDDGSPIRWIEVKAMMESLQDRPVGMSRQQFEVAREAGDAFWLYIVEHAADDERARIVRIQDPARKTQTFTFDRGWVAVAEGNDELE